MGCCKSSPDIDSARSNRRNSIRTNLPLTETEMAQLETFLSDIPNHYQKPIINLPERQLLKFYQYHKMALYHSSQKEWPLAITYEYQAIKGLQLLLPTNKDHYIFFNFYSILSASFLALGELQAAIEGIHIVLAILLKHTPMDHKRISNNYYHLANAHKVLKNWKETVQYLILATEIARLRNDLDEEFIRMLETELQMAKQQIARNTSFNFKFFEVKRKRGENDYDFHRRKTAETITFMPKHCKSHFHKKEFKYLPNKQTKLEVHDEILKIISTDL